jgi:DNA polymerase
MLYEDIPDTLSQLIRTAFIPSPGYRFIVSDFSAIEARVIAWYADQKWRIEAFKNGEDIYCASASKMFRVPVEKHGKNANLRQKGKIAELALGYGGACGALKAMGALDMGLKESELPGLVRTWREANPDIVDFWKRVGEAAFHVVEIGKSEDAQVEVEEKLDRLTFKYRKGSLFITLPSGRFLAYQFPKITINEETGNKSLSYMFIGPDKKWGRIETYGPKLVENIVQATARDILCHAMKGLRDYRIVMHVHDELIIEAKEDVSLDYVTKKMAEVPSWAEGLLLRADGYECQFYQKD